MKRLLLLLTIAALVSAPAFAAPSFFDNFENGVSGSVWAKYTGSNDNLLSTDTSHNVTPGGSKSARAFASDPAQWNAYHDFGSTTESVWADVWVYEDFSNNGSNPSQPITNMLALLGDTGGTVGTGADYLQLGVVPFWPGGSTTYGWRSKYGDANQGGSQSVGISRKQGWTHLAIQADSLAIGGQVRFYIDGALVGTTQRTAASLRWVRLGNNSKSYENFWYDDVRVVPEPGSIVALGGGLLSAMGLMLRRRSA